MSNACFIYGAIALTLMLDRGEAGQYLRKQRLSSGNKDLEVNSIPAARPQPTMCGKSKQATRPSEQRPSVNSFPPSCPDLNTPAHSKFTMHFWPAGWADLRAHSRHTCNARCSAMSQLPGLFYPQPSTPLESSHSEPSSIHWMDYAD